MPHYSTLDDEPRNIQQEVTPDRRLSSSPGWNICFCICQSVRCRVISTDGGRVIINDGSGNEIGTAKFTQVSDGVMVSVSVSDLTPGFHGFHVHAIGDCTGPSFTSAGGHYDPDIVGHQHHAGDMPGTACK